MPAPRCGTLRESVIRGILAGIEPRVRVTVHRLPEGCIVHRARYDIRGPRTGVVEGAGFPLLVAER